MSWTSVPHAHEYWRLTRGLADPPRDLEAAEAFILQATPSTKQDAICIVDVVRAYGGDARCDGLDTAALARVQHYLAAAD